MDELVCFQRDYLEPVPGCVGAGLVSYDYCHPSPENLPEPTDPVTLPEPTLSLVEIAAGNPDFSILVELLILSGLDQTLTGPGPFTVLAPTNDAFLKLPAEKVEALKQDPQGSLTDVLLYHVIVDEVTSDQFVNEGSVPTALAGFDVTTYTNPLVVNNANVISPNILASNGVAHIIDTVLLPGESLDPWLVTIVGDTNLPLGLCEGDCDNDDQCLDELICFQREYLEPVRGCRGLGRVSYDYCVKPLPSVLPEQATDAVPPATDPVVGPPEETDVISPVPETSPPAATLPEPGQNIVQILAASPNYSTLVELLTMTGLGDTLQGDGLFTVLAPDNQAFAQLPPGTLERLKADVTGELTDLLLYHVIVEYLLSSDLADAAASTPTLEGVAFSTALSGSAVFVTVNPLIMVNDANVQTMDVIGTNGVIHVIDKVLLPPGFDLGVVDEDITVIAMAEEAPAEGVLTIVSLDTGTNTNSQEEGGIQKLGRCQGKCDDSGDCAEGLICSNFPENTPIPGCDGSAGRYSFCYNPMDGV